MLDDRHGRGARLLLSLTRLWLPLAIAIAGIVLIVVGGGHTRGTLGDSLASTGLVLVGVAILVWMVSWLFRLSARSNREREQEEEARNYFEEHGRWPGEPADE